MFKLTWPRAFVLMLFLAASVATFLWARDLGLQRQAAQERRAANLPRAFRLPPMGAGAATLLGHTRAEVRATLGTPVEMLPEADHFDVGVTFDGDADRALLVDGRGRVVTGDHIMAICAVTRGEREIVATHMSNLGMERYLQGRGIAVRRVKVGDRYVHEELKRSGLRLGGEQSGHVLFLDKAPTGDGILTALQVLAAVRQSGRPLEAWMDEIPVYPQELVNVAVPAELKEALPQAPEVAAAVRAAEAELGDAGRLLLRPSGTEPLVRVMAEGPDHDVVRSVVDSVAAAVRRASGTTAAADA